VVPTAAVLIMSGHRDVESSELVRGEPEDKIRKV
jgi:hypothetical protein